MQKQRHLEVKTDVKRGMRYSDTIQVSRLDVLLAYINQTQLIVSPSLYPFQTLHP